MGLTTQDLHIQKEYTELYKIVKFRVNWANIEQDTAIQNLQNLQRNVWISGQVSVKCMDFRTSVWQCIHLLLNFYVFEWLYLVQYWRN